MLRKTRVQLNFNPGFAARRLHEQLLKYKPSSVKIVDKKPKKSLEFLVGNPYTEENIEVIKRIEDPTIEKIFWLFYSCENDTTLMPEHFRNSKAIITTLPSIEAEYPDKANMIPLGADPEVFYPENRLREFLVHTHGYDLRAESIKYVYLACKEQGGKQCHIGSDFDSLNSQSGDILDKNYINIHCDITDDEMKRYYNSSRFVSGLRLIEGFEMPIIEGAMCACRPITYDLPCYKRWFSEFAAFVPFVGEPEKDGEPFGNSEQRAKELISSIQQIFNQHSCLNKSQIDYVKNTFSWARIMPTIWEIINER